jgi:hypothetical protein
MIIFLQFLPSVPPESVILWYILMKRFNKVFPKIIFELAQPETPLGELTTLPHTP